MKTLHDRGVADAGSVQERLEVYRAMRRRDGGSSALDRLVDLLEAELRSEDERAAGPRRS
jgi:hypothetical protein